MGLATYFNFKSITIILCIVSLLAGCKSMPSSVLSGKMVEAKLAIESAQECKAEDIAPVELRYAIDHLNRAERANQRNDYVRAERLAERAIVNAQLAIAKSNAETAQLSANDAKDAMHVVEQQTDDPWDLIMNSKQGAYY